ncbi:MAG: chorismate synthase [Bacteroidetes bacterium]|nr:chorismate synthase [Bacteroidota bacterium]
MAGNTIGKAFRLTSFGESHGVAIGGVVDGCPSNIPFDLPFIQAQLDRRSPGNSPFSSPRTEKDKIEVLSGIFEGKTTGAPIAFLIFNKDKKSEDYDSLRDIFRPSHADFSWFEKYGIRDHRGGGRSSARETAVRVAGGAIAQHILRKKKVDIQAYVDQIGPIHVQTPYHKLNLANTINSPLQCPDPGVTQKMTSYLKELASQGDTSGGAIVCVVRNLPSGLGEPVFDKLQADLAKAMMSLPAARGFEYGAGFTSATMKGTEHNDPFILRKEKITLAKNDSGGIQGGISVGSDIYFRVAFKPPASVSNKQQTVNCKKQPVEIQIKGRHDVCFVPRAVVVVESMCAMVMADHWLRAGIK